MKGLLFTFLFLGAYNYLLFFHTFFKAEKRVGSWKAVFANRQMGFMSVTGCQSFSGNCFRW